MNALDISSNRQASEPEPSLAPDRSQLVARAVCASILESTQQPFCAVWDLTFLYCNPALAALLGYDAPADLIGRPFLSVVPESEAGGFIERQQRRTLGEEVESRYEARLLRRDGTEIWVDMITQLSTFDGQPAVLASLHDVTQLRATQQDLARSLAMLQATLESSSDGILVVDRQGKISAWNRRFLELWGVPEELLLQRDDAAAIASVLDKLCSPDEFLASVQRLNSHPAESCHDEIRLKDGRIFERITQPQWINGEAAGRVWNFRDITARLAAEDELRESRSILEATQETGGVGSWAAEMPQGRIYWSRHAYELYGYDAATAVPSMETFIEAVHPEDRERVQKTISAAMASGIGHDHEYRLLLTDGRVRWIHSRSRLERAADGSVTRIQGMDMDITARKQAEQQLAQSLSLLRATLESSADGILVVDNAGEVVIYNERFLELWGVSSELMQIRDRKERLDLLSAKLRDPSTFIGLIREMDHNELADSLDTLELLDGRIFERHTRPQLVDGQVVGRVFNIRDITARRRSDDERRKLAAQLNQAQKMEAIGTLAGGIAHDFNNILFAILGYAEMVMQSLPDSSSARQDQLEVITAARRAAELVQHILTFSRQNVAEPVPVQVSVVVREVLRLLRATLPSNILINSRLEDESCAVLADPMQLHQVLMNLGTNAGQAMQEQGGRLDVGLRRFTVDADGLEARRGLKPGPYLILSVKDTGQGISPEILDRIFDPFFTTKEVGSGTGLGLSTVHGIVASLGGDVTVYTELGRGTVFNVYLPCTHLDGSAVSLPATALPRGSESILYVDDEASLARLGHEMLERLGYQVHAFSDSQQAWEEFRASPEAFDLVITDQTMPGLTGRDLARRVMKLRPGQPVILCTGFSHVMSEQMAQELGLADYLLKPITSEDLAKAVRRALDTSKVSSS